MSSKVAVIKTTPADVIPDIGQLMELAGVSSALDPSATTIIKDNLSWHMMFPGANTTPWQLQGVIRGLRQAGISDLVAVENDTVVTNAEKGARLNKLQGVYESLDIPVLHNFHPEDMKWIRYEPKCQLRVLDKIFPEGIEIPDFFLDKNIVHLPTMKCHIYTTTTGAMKNAFGGLLHRRRHYTHSVIHETLVDLLAIQKEIHPGIFAVMDGTTAGCGPGPRTMTPVITDYILASSDSVAIDAVAAKIMGFDPMTIDYIRIAHEAGLGVGRPEEIEIEGEDISGVNLGFHVGNNMVSRFGRSVWFGPLHFMQNLLFRTWLVYFFVFGSAFYHDSLWYPLVGRRRARRWMRETEWGKLFQNQD